VGIDHEQHAGELRHVLDAAERLQQVVALAAEAELLALGQREHGAVLLHLLEAAQALERALHGLEVGERAAEPALGDVELAGSRGLLADDVLRLLLGADEQHRLAARADVDDRLERAAEQLDRVLQVDDVDAVARAEDEGLHLRVPAAGVVAEVDARLEQLAHRDGRRAGIAHRVGLGGFHVVLRWFPPAPSSAPGTRVERARPGASEAVSFGSSPVFRGRARSTTRPERAQARESAWFPVSVLPCEP
jgi:hypothetical protein